jgi:hypothetical protein
LTEQGHLFRGSGLLGACVPISVLPLRKGQLHPRDRPSYDSGDGALGMKELLAELGRASE